MSVRSVVKGVLFGKPGSRPRDINHGLLRGLRFHIDPGHKSQRLIGLDEREITGAMQDLASKARTALDIGANDGWYSVYFASLPNIERVIAFEPGEEVRREMDANFSLNDPAMSRKLKVVGKMVGSRDDDSWCTVDSFLPELQKPVMLKIDVEGGELEVLKGARSLLQGGGCHLLIETHSEEMERECDAMLRSMGYETRVIKNGWYRSLLRENRELPHNRWLAATRPA